MPDATIIGAGPAGSVAAVVLARAGWDVSLVEQHRFPRDKVCGECLSRLGIEVLERLGLSELIRTARPSQLVRTILYASDGTAVEVPLPSPMWGISRLALDPLLLSAADEAGAKVWQPARVESLEHYGGTCLRVRDLETNRLREHQCGVCIVADGKGSLLPRRPVTTGDFGIKAHFRGVSSAGDAVELFGVRGSYGGVAAVEDGRFNVAFSVPAERLRASGGDLDAVFWQMREENDALGRKFVSAERITEWIASPLPRFAVGDGWPAGTIPVGNAASAIEPVGGEGMGLAMRSAEMAAGALVASGGNPTQLDRARLLAAYRSLWTRRRIACRAVALILSRPAVAQVAARLASHDQRIVPAVAGWMGK